MNTTQLNNLIHELCALPAETSWVEFKVNNADPLMIGDQLSGLSNAAALEGSPVAWMVWGIRDTDHSIVGTDFEPTRAKHGNEQLESWLARLLEPRIPIQFHNCEIAGKRIVILRVPAATTQPVAFKGKESIRIGSTNRSLKEFPQWEKMLWRKFENDPFEVQVALANCADVLEKLDCNACFRLLSLPMPDSPEAILDRLASEGIVSVGSGLKRDITNLGAILFAKSLKDFPALSGKAVRLISYEGNGRLGPSTEFDIPGGYATGLERMVSLFEGILPGDEVINGARRESRQKYPIPALRELIVNALTHQDFLLSGMSPKVELFDNRVEVFNAGVPIGDLQRLLDHPPITRNERLAAIMRRMRFSEERGSGVDKVVFACEEQLLPPPTWEKSGEGTRATIFSAKEFKDMDRMERIRACYLHACLRYVMREKMTNASLRQRFGINGNNTATVSRIITGAIQENQIKPADPTQGKKHAKYLPHWA